MCVCARARVSATIDSSSSLCVRLLSVSQSCVSESQPSTDLGRNKKHLAFASSGGSRGQIRPCPPSKLAMEFHRVAERVGLMIAL